jgi:ketosteroid isomerase-like protein
LELVRSIYADWELGDWSSATWAHPDIAYVMVDEPGSHVYVGLAEMARAWRSFLSAWEAYRVQPVDFRSLDRERVLVIVRAHGRGKASGLELDDSTTHRGANLFHIRDGRVTRLDAYFDAAHALADLGLTE